MRPVKLLSIVVLAAAGLFPKSAPAQKPTFVTHIQVHVRLPDGSAAPAGVLCELELQNKELVEQIPTDSGGKCQFAPPGSNIYLIRVTAPGFLAAVQRVDLQNSPSAMVLLTLKRIPGPAPPEPANGAAGSSVSAIDLSVPDLARKEFDLGQHAIEARDLDGGIAHLKRAIELHDQFPQAYTMLGIAYNEQKKWRDAQSTLEKAIGQDPKAVEPYFQLGASLNQQKDSAGAVKALGKGLELNPDAPDAAAAQYELARAHVALGQWQEANPHAAKAVALQPDVATWHILMAKSHLLVEDAAEEHAEGAGGVHFQGMTALLLVVAWPGWLRDPLTLGAISTGVIALATIVSLIVNVFLWRSTGKAAEAAGVSADAARKSAEFAAALNRPYMGILNLKRMCDRNYPAWPILWVLKNFGTLPANDVDASLELSLDGKTRLTEHASHSGDLFPESQIETRTELRFNEGELRNITDGKWFPDGRILVRYKAPNGNGYEYTAQIRYDHGKDIFMIDKSETKSA